MLGRPLRRRYDSRRRFCGVIAASLVDATHAVLIVLVAAIRMALDMTMAATKLEPISILSKLKARQVKAITSNYVDCTFCCDLVDVIESGCRFDCVSETFI